MIRRLATIALAATLLPAGAEAAKMRFGGSRSSHASTETRGSGGTTIIAPRIGRSQAADAKPGDPARVPFPPSSAEPVLLKVTNDASKSWCRSEVVVGGFCMLN